MGFYGFFCAGSRLPFRLVESLDYGLEIFQNKLGVYDVYISDRIHPLLDWTELNIWEYIDREKIPTVSLYYDQGNGKRYRSLGCYPCTFPVESTARNPREIIEELKTGKFANIAERSGRAQDKDDGGGLETLRRDGYM